MRLLSIITLVWILSLVLVSCGSPMPMTPTVDPTQPPSAESTWEAAWHLLPQDMRTPQSVSPSVASLVPDGGEPSAAQFMVALQAMTTEWTIIYGEEETERHLKSDTMRAWYEKWQFKYANKMWVPPPLPTGRAKSPALLTAAQKKRFWELPWNRDLRGPMPKKPAELFKK